MSGIGGWSSAAGSEPQGREVIERMAAVVTRFDAPAHGVHLEKSTGLVSAGNGAHDFALHVEDDLVVACSGALRLASPGAEEQPGETVARAIARAFRLRGTECLTLLNGAFALAILDRRSGELVLAIDRMGIHQLCYCVTGQTLVFGSRLDMIREFPGIESKVDRQAVYDYVHFHMVPAPQTIYAGMRRIPAGTFLKWSNGRADLRPYWEMRFEEHHDRPFPDLREEFLSLLRQSVRDATGDLPTGTFLSGGTDSSTIAGILGEVSGQPARTYSIGFQAAGYDEMEYARIAARHFGTAHHEYYVTPDDVVSAIPKIAAVHDQPFGNASAVPTYYCAKLARDDGVERLLGGDGGDELFGGNERYATQYLYSLYSDLPRGLRKSVIEPLAFLVPEAGLPGKVQRYIRGASIPMPARYDRYNLLEKLGPDTVFTREFLGAVQTALPSRQMAHAYDDAHASSLINHMLALDLKYTLADNDLPKVTRSCELANIAVAFPLLSDPIVHFSSRLRPGLKLKRTRLRYFFKEALRGFLPDEIITKSKHGFGLPFGPWVAAHRGLRETVNGSLESLKKQQIVRADFIDDLLNVRIAEHAGYYGTMVWVLMMLEQWLKQHRATV